MFSRFGGYSFIRSFVSKSCSDVFFHFRKCRNSKILSVFFVVIRDDFNKSILFELDTAVIINAWVKQSCDFKLRIKFFEQAIVIDSLRNTTCRKYCVELAVMAQRYPIFKYILYYCRSMFRRCVLNIWDIIFNALNIVAFGVEMPNHSNLICVHIFIEDFTLNRFGNCFFLCLCFCLFQSNNFSHIFIFESQYLVWVKAKNILVSDSIRNTVSVKFITKHSACSVLFLLVFVLNRRTGKAEEHCLWKCVFDCQQHISKSRAMSFIYDKHNTLFTDKFNVTSIQSACFVLNVTHFLN